MNPSIAFAGRRAHGMFQPCLRRMRVERNLGQACLLPRSAAFAPCVPRDQNGCSRRASLADKALSAGCGGVHCGSVRAPQRCALPDVNVADRKASITGRRYAFYLVFLGARFFGPFPVEDPASSPWQGQASLNASMATVIPGSLARSGLLSRYPRKTLALCKGLPCAGGHARTLAGRFGEKSIAVSIIPSHTPADRASS
ncbi:hypothetical protein EDE08_10946 [Bradyrhizobium sp. R2.2-H]|nr:hypothetical protein EDE10_109367 [Bradyrhizobium sp. Y-H1]TCU69830.1 hypothetical protein EDE08_10946 [Bradyrhizobium sp. R2.2-H]